VALGESSKLPESLPFNAAINVVLAQVHFGIGFLNDIDPNVIRRIECECLSLFDLVLDKPIVHEHSLGNSVHKHVYGKQPTLV